MIHRRTNPWKTRRRGDPAPARARQAQSPDSFHHYVYVVLLDPQAARLRAVRQANPDRDPEKPCLYVGMTGLDPRQRFQNHKRGYKAAPIVKRFGIRLLPDLYECFNPMPYQAAAQMEKDLAEDLRREGYTVTGGH